MQPTTGCHATRWVHNKGSQFAGACIILPISTYIVYFSSTAPCPALCPRPPLFWHGSLMDLASGCVPLSCRLTLFSALPPILVQVLLAGGFCCSAYAQFRLRDALQSHGCSVITLQRPASAVVEGERAREWACISHWIEMVATAIHLAVISVVPMSMGACRT